MILFNRLVLSAKNNKTCDDKDNYFSFLKFFITDISTIDKLNNCFLSNFLFKLTEHDEICGHLGRQDVDSAASRLQEIMKLGDAKTMNLLFDTLQKGKIQIPQELFKMKTRYGTSEKYDGRYLLITGD